MQQKLKLLLSINFLQHLGNLYKFSLRRNIIEVCKTIKPPYAATQTVADRGSACLRTHDLQIAQIFEYKIKLLCGINFGAKISFQAFIVNFSLMFWAICPKIELW